jgi:hypothetical protein
MNNKEETSTIKDQDTKNDSQENNGAELNVEKNLENNS